MRIDAALVGAETVAASREAHRREMGSQIVHDSWLARGLADAYELRVDGRAAGYGLVGGAPGAARETIVEFHVYPRREPAEAIEMFSRLIAASGARVIVVQTNDAMFMGAARRFMGATREQAILFADGGATALVVHGAVFRRRTAKDAGRVFEHTSEPVGDWVVEAGGEIVASGGFLTHYNPPFADLHMEVAPDRRRSGYGSLLVQELRRVCREAGRVPAARCNPANHASEACLLRGGMVESARMLRSDISGGVIGQPA